MLEVWGFGKKCLGKAYAAIPMTQKCTIAIAVKDLRGKGHSHRERLVMGLQNQNKGKGYYELFFSPICCFANLNPFPE